MNRSETILYVEDDAVTLTAYGDLLQRAGFTVKTARDGLEGLKLLRQTVPDLLLLDLLLPRFTGEEMLKFMAGDLRLRQIPVVVLSTNTVVDMNNEGLVGAAQFQLLKHSCTPEQLLQTIGKVLAETSAARNGHVPPETTLEAMPLRQLNEEKMGLAEQPDGVATPTIPEIQELQNQPQVICAWTNRIKVAGEWMSFSEFLAKRLHLTVTHGVSPDAREEIMKAAKGT